MRRVTTVLAGMAALAACAARETPQQTQARMEQESAALKVAASAVERRHEAFYAAGQPDSLASTFTENGRVLPSNEPGAVGRAAIRDQQAQGMSAYTQKLTVTSQSVMANGPLGVETGTYAYEGTLKKGAPRGMPAKVTDHGNYMIHWHNVNGTWLIADLMYTSSEPTPTLKAIMTAMTNAAKAPAPAGRR